MSIGTPVLLGTSSTTSAGTSTCVLSVANDSPLGNLIVVFCGINNGTNLVSGVADSVGNSYSPTTAFHAAVGLAQIWYCDNALELSPIHAGTITVTWTASGGRREVSALSVSGMSLTSVLDVTGTPTTGTGNTLSVSTGTLARPNELVCGIGLVATGSSSFVEAAGFTNAGRVNNIEELLSAYQVVASTASVTYAPHWTGSVAYIGNVVSFRGGPVSAQLVSGGIGAAAFSGIRGALGAVGAQGRGTPAFAGASSVTASTASAGAATVAFAGTAVFPSGFSASGAGVTALRATATAAASLDASGAATVAVVPEITRQAALSAVGSATGSLAGAFTLAGQAVLTVAGMGSAAFSGTALKKAVLTASGAATVADFGTGIGKAILATSGAATVGLGGTELTMSALAVAGAGTLSAAGVSFVVAQGALSISGAASVALVGAAISGAAVTITGRAATSLVGNIAPLPSGESVAESLGQQGPLNASLKLGLETLSEHQVVCFKRYVKIILPYDGFVFWVRADLLTPSALFNANPYNTNTYNQARTIAVPAHEICVKGSLHYTTTNRQDQDESFAVNRVVFTSEEKIQDLNDISPTEMYIATLKPSPGDQPIRFGFSQRSSFYKQAGIHHYSGDAVYPVMESQIIDYPETLNTRDVVVSNSLPIWLGLNSFSPVYPSFLVADSIPPPYMSVHIGEDDTEALQPFPLIDICSNHWQLTRDRVRITTYGLRNNQIMDFLDYVYANSLSAGTFGIVGRNPIVRDAKRGQAELGILAQKKIIEFEVSYYQTRMRDVARQLIKTVFISYGFPPNLVLGPPTNVNEFA